MIRVDPRTKADRARAARLLDAHPDADGVAKKLSRSDVPDAYRNLRAVTLLGAAGAIKAEVRKAGVRPSPSDGAFVFVLDTATTAFAGEFAVAIEGDAPSSWRPIEPGGSLPGLGGDAALDLQATMAGLDRDGIDRDPRAKFVPVAAVDLDADAQEELLVFENWPEGRYVWMLRLDGRTLVADLVCGDAA